MSTAPITDAASQRGLSSPSWDLGRWVVALASTLLTALAWVRRTGLALRRHRFLFVAVTVVDAMLLAAIGNTYFYYKQPELVASVGPMYSPEVQKYLFVVQVCVYVAVLLGVRGARRLLQRRA